MAKQALEVLVSDFQPPPEKKVGDSIPIDFRPGYAATIILRSILEDPEKHIIVFSWWALAGRMGPASANVSLTIPEGRMIRIDVPPWFHISTSGLEAELKKWWSTQDTLPNDSPVIKG